MSAKVEAYSPTLSWSSGGSPAPPYSETMSPRNSSSPLLGLGLGSDQGAPRYNGRRASSRRVFAYVLVFAAVCILVGAWHAGSVEQSHETESELGTTRKMGHGTRRKIAANETRIVPGVAELLSPLAPSAYLYDALRPDLRYLITDTWSGMSGQFTAALSQLYLARLTQRVAIIPSWSDELHYGRGNAVRMSDLFDMESFRQATGALFVELDDVKPRSGVGLSTTADLVGCFRASPLFDAGNSFREHDIEQVVIDVDVPARWTWSYEAFALFDMDTNARLSAARRFFGSEQSAVPRNIRDESRNRQGGGLMCLANIWDLQQVGSGIQSKTRESHYGNPPREYVATSSMSDLLTAELSGTHPEWWHIGRHIDFSSVIWEIAMSCVRATLKLEVPPSRRAPQPAPLPPLLTVHIRRGDFLQFCQGQSCTPALPRFEVAVADLKKDLPEDARVLVTTDEASDMEFLGQIDELGWARIDHAALGTAEKLKEAFGESWRWADAAVDQAILSLGSAFVGTHGSQVTQLSQLRVEAWNGGESRIVGA